MFEIYLITNLINGKVYVGRTSFGREYRWKQHLYNAEQGKRNLHLYAAMRKYGSENFTLGLLEITESEEEVNASEVKWIASLKSRNREFGYNMTAGGDGARVLREESIQKMKDFASERFSNKENMPWYRSDIDNEEVARRYLNGSTILTLSKELNMAPSAINERLKKADIPRRGKRLPIASEEIVALYESGRTAAEIADVFSVNKTCILRRLKKLGVSRRRPGARVKHGRYSKKETGLGSCSGTEQTLGLSTFLPGASPSLPSQCTSSAPAA